MVVWYDQGSETVRQRLRDVDEARGIYMYISFSPGTHTGHVVAMKMLRAGSPGHHDWRVTVKTRPPHFSAASHTHGFLCLTFYVCKHVMTILLHIHVLTIFCHCIVSFATCVKTYIDLFLRRIVFSLNSWLFGISECQTCTATGPVTPALLRGRRNLGRIIVSRLQYSSHYSARLELIFWE